MGLFSPGWCSSRSSSHAIFSPLVGDPMNSAGTSSNAATFLGGAHTGVLHRATHDQKIPHDVHAQCCEWPQLLHSYYLHSVGQENLNTPSWLISCLSTVISSFFFFFSTAWGRLQSWYYKKRQHGQQKLQKFPVNQTGSWEILGKWNPWLCIWTGTNPGLRLKVHIHG